MRVTLVLPEDLEFTGQNTTLLITERLLALGDVVSRLLRPDTTLTTEIRPWMKEEECDQKGAIKINPSCSIEGKRGAIMAAAKETRGFLEALLMLSTGQLDIIVYHHGTVVPSTTLGRCA